MDTCLSNAKQQLFTTQKLAKHLDEFAARFWNAAELRKAASYINDNFKATNTHRAKQNAQICKPQQYIYASAIASSLSWLDEPSCNTRSTPFKQKLLRRSAITHRKPKILPHKIQQLIENVALRIAKGTYKCTITCQYPREKRVDKYNALPQQT